MKLFENGNVNLLRVLKTAVAGALLFAISAAGQTAKPVALECESLTTPLGMDAKTPLLSWKIQDSRAGARQTAYEIQVASSSTGLTMGKVDIWDSGRVESGSSIGVKYGGPALAVSKRYFWRVLAWDRDGKQYSASDVSWWETGLLEQENWKAKWIGYEEPELRAVRDAAAVWITNAETEAPKAAEKTEHDFRFRFELKKAVRRGVLYMTGQDTASAWVNGKQELQADPLTPWRQMPWKTYSFREVTKDLRDGKNLLAVEVVHYSPSGGRAQSVARTPMSAVLYVEATDGSVETFAGRGVGGRRWMQAGIGKRLTMKTLHGRMRFRMCCRRRVLMRAILGTGCRMGRSNLCGGRLKWGSRLFRLEFMRRRWGRTNYF